MADVPVVGQQAADVIRAALTRWVPYGFRDDDGVWHEGVCQTEALAALERLVVERDAAERALEEIAETPEPLSNKNSALNQCAYLKELARKAQRRG